MCDNKKQHPSKDAAYAAKRRLVKDNFIFHKVHVYKCPFCKKWHVGRNQKVDLSVFKRLR